MLYLDTSALLKLYLREEGSAWVQDQVRSQSLPLPIMDFQEAELANALRLKVYWGEIRAEQADAQWELFLDRCKRGQYVFPQLDRQSMMRRFHELSRRTMNLGCRTMDVLHVACALEIGASHFVSFDQRQLSLAKEVMPVAQAPS